MSTNMYCSPGTPVTLLHGDEHVHGIIVNTYTGGDALVRWDDTKPNYARLMPGHDDVLVWTEQCGAPTTAGPCTDQAKPGDDHCAAHGGCPDPTY